MGGALAYALVTGALVALGCWALEGLCRAWRLPTRWTWALGLVATVVMGVNAALTVGAPRAPAGAVRIVGIATPVVGAPRASLDVVLDASGAALNAAVRAVAWLVPARLATAAPLAWLLVSALGLLATVLVHRRIARARRAWPRAELHGCDVRIAPSVGPAVLGIREACIVVPRWLLARSDDEQRLVLAHEGEHVRARDHLLLAAAWVVAALMPWQPAVWWMLSRLRLAIELDCDARVLRRGVAPRTYGTLLIDLASQCRGIAVGATALADESSHLERRLRAMKPIASRYTTLRAGALLSAGLLAVLAACEAKVPTSAEIEKMDVAGVEKSASQMKVMGTTAAFYVDGVLTDEATAHAIAPNRIATVNIEKQPDGSAIIRIVTLAAARVANADGSSGPIHVKLSGVTPDGQKYVGTNDSMTMKPRIAVGNPPAGSRSIGLTDFDGTVFVNDVLVTNKAELARLRPEDIISMNVIKHTDGPTGGPSIRITTRKN